MKKLFSIATLVILGFFLGSSSNAGGLYIAGEGAYAVSTSSVSVLTGLTSIAPGATLGYHLIGGEKGKRLGLEASWVAHSFDGSLSSSALISASFKYDITSIYGGLRYWFWYLSVKAGYARHGIKGTSTLTVAGLTQSATTNTTESGLYFGGGLDLPLSMMFDLFADYTHFIYGTDFAAHIFSGGIRVNF